MKKLSASFTSILMTLLFALMPIPAAASTTLETLAPSAVTAIANNSAAITFTVQSQRYRCSKQYQPPAPTNPYYYYPTNDPGECSHVTSGYSPTPQDLSPAELVPNVDWHYSVTVSGSGNTLSASSFTTDSSGHASFTLKSSVAQSKTVSLLEQSKGSYVVASTTVTFTSPAATAAPVKPTTPTPVPSTPSPTPSPAPPSAPALNAVKIGADPIDATKPISLEQSKPLVLSGTTLANATITLTIHSTPKTVTTTADKDGHWSYTVTDLEPGEHYIEASVTDPATHQASSPVKLLSFKVAGTNVTPSNPRLPKASPSPWTWISLGAGLIVLVVGGWYGWRQWRKSKSIPAPDQAQMPPASPTT